MLITLGLIPVLFLIHALKPKPRQVDVTNLFLWQTVFKERTSNITLKKLKKNLPLLLQIVIIMLIALALAGPVWLFLTQKKGDMIVVVDTSASMKTRLASGTRFDLARKKALDLIDQRHGDQKILIIEAGSEPTLKSGILDDSNQAATIIKGLEPSDTPGKFEKALYLALSFIKPAQNDTVYLITDGAGFDFPKLLETHPGIVPMVVSGGERNVGITKFEFRQALDRKDTYEIMLEVKNFNPLPVACPLRLSIDRTVILKTRIHLDREEKKLLIFPYSGLITGIAKAALEIDDDFTVDNTAYLSLSNAKDIWILLVSKGNYFLENLLASYPNMMVNSVKEITPSSWEEQTQRHDIVIVDRMDFPLTERGNFLLIDSFSPSLPILEAGRIDFPQILDWDKTSPLMANADVGGLMIEQAAKLEAEGALRPVIESSETGLMYTYEAASMRAVVLGFDITRSNLPLKVAFPVMMSNIINWLNPNKLHFSVLQTKAGDPISIYLDHQTTDFSIRPPRERWQKHRAVSNPFTYKHTKTVGIYTVSENNKRKYFTVNLMDESESDIVGPSPDDMAVNPGAAVDAEKISERQSMWMLFLLLGLAVLMAEWYFWLKFG